jgi:hypothetical protein
MEYIKKQPSIPHIPHSFQFFLIKNNLGRLTRGGFPAPRRSSHFEIICETWNENDIRSSGRSIIVSIMFVDPLSYLLNVLLAAVVIVLVITRLAAGRLIAPSL